MSLGENELARREDGRVEIRHTPLRLNWTFPDLTTAGLHTLRATFSCSMMAVDSSADRAMLEEVLLGDRTSIGADAVAAHFGPAIRAAMAPLIEQSTAEDLVAGRKDQAILEELTRSAERVAFACGLQVLPPFQLQLSSRSLEQQRLEEAARARMEQRTAGQVEHLRRAGDLLRQFQEIRAASPQLSAGAVLQQMSPADRGAALETLLLAQAQEADRPTLWAVAGPHLVRIATGSDEARAEIVHLPIDVQASAGAGGNQNTVSLGPLRSVQGIRLDQRRMLLMGARQGLLLLDPGNAAEAAAYVDPSLESQHGFSRAVAWKQGEELLACHSEGGLVAWSRGKSDAPAWQVRGSELANSIGLSGELPRIGPKNLQTVDEQSAIFSMGHRLLLLQNREVHALPENSDSEIVGIVPAADVLLVVHHDGLVAVFERNTVRVTRRLHHWGSVTAAAALPWMDSVRLLLASQESAIDCIGIDDQLVTRYVSNHRGMRMVVGSGDVVAAVSPDRQRLIVWNSWDGRAPVAEVYVTGVARHRIADVDFA